MAHLDEVNRREMRRFEAERIALNAVRETSEFKRTVDRIMGKLEEAEDAAVADLVGPSVGPTSIFTELANFPGV